MAAKKATARRSNASFKDIQISYLMNGVSAVETLVRQGRASKPSIRRALRELGAAGRNVEPLERWVTENLGGSGRGRAPPGSGDTRTYKAQQVKTGGPFLRLPLDVLGVKKAGTVRVRFERDQIVISP